MANKKAKKKKKYNKGGKMMTPDMWTALSAMIPGIAGSFTGQHNAPGAGGDMPGVTGALGAAGSVASLLPGAGPAIGLGLNALSAVSENINIPSDYVPMGVNQGKYSRKNGGSLTSNTEGLPPKGSIPRAAYEMAYKSLLRAVENDPKTRYDLLNKGADDFAGDRELYSGASTHYKWDTEGPGKEKVDSLRNLYNKGQGAVMMPVFANRDAAKNVEAELLGGERKRYNYGKGFFKRVTDPKAVMKGARGQNYSASDFDKEVLRKGSDFNEPTKKFSKTRQALKNLDNKSSYEMGGQLNRISSNSVEVEAYNPRLTDSVELPNAFVDNDEMITKMQYGGSAGEDFVFSNKLVDPRTGNTFAKDEKKRALATAKVENSEYDPIAKNTAKYLKEISGNAADLNQKLAGLMEKSKQYKQQMKYGGKLGYKNGGELETAWQHYQATGDNTQLSTIAAEQGLTMQDIMSQMGGTRKSTGTSRANSQKKDMTFWDAAKKVLPNMIDPLSGLTQRQAIKQGLEVAGAMVPLPIGKAAWLKRMRKINPYNKWLKGVAEGTEQVSTPDNWRKYAPWFDDATAILGKGVKNTPPSSPLKPSGSTAVSKKYAQQMQQSLKKTKKQMGGELKPKYQWGNPINTVPADYQQWTTPTYGYNDPMSGVPAAVQNPLQYLQEELGTSPVDYSTNPAAVFTPRYNLLDPTKSPQAQAPQAQIPVGEDPGARALADALKSRQGNKTGKKKTTSPITDPNYLYEPEVEFDPYPGITSNPPLPVSSGWNKMQNKYGFFSDKLKAAVDAFDSSKVPGVPGQYDIATSEKRGMFGDKSEGERLQMMEFLGKSAMMLQGRDKQTLYQNRAPINRQQFDPQNALMQQQYAANAARQGLQASGTGASMQANLQNLGANQMRAGAQVQTQYDQMNKQADLQYQQQMAQRQQENIGYKYATDQIRQQDDAAYWNQFRDVLTGIGGLGREKVSVEENEKAVRLLISAYPDISPFLKSLGVDLSKFQTTEKKGKQTKNTEG